MDRFVLGSPVTVTATFSVSGAPTDPTTLVLTVMHPDGVIDADDAVNPAAPTLPIVRDGAGSFHAVITPATMGRWVYRWVGTGTAPGANEGEFLVVSKIVEGLAVISAPSDYDAVRAVLGVTGADVDDELIELPSFGPQAERDVEDRMGTAAWDLIVSPALGEELPEQFYRLRICLIYLSSALIAESYALGGTIGNIAPSDNTRDWIKEAARFRAIGETWLARILDVDGPDVVEEYDLPMMKVGGPTRAVRRLQQIASPSWWRYPPVIGVPPDWQQWWW